MTQFIANLVRVPLMEDPGTRYRYSEGTSVLGRLVEIWSGKPFEVFLEERIFRPLAHDRHDVLGRHARPARAAHHGVWPRPGGGLMPVETETLPFTERPTLIEGAVGLLSTVPDYLRFSQMLLNKGELDGVRMLSAKTVETMTRNGLSEAVQKTRGGSMGWGLGNVQVLLNDRHRPGQQGRVRVGRHGRHDLLGRSGQGNGHRADDPEPAVESRPDPRSGSRPSSSRLSSIEAARSTYAAAETRPRSPMAGARSRATAPYRFLP